MSKRMSPEELKRVIREEVIVERFMLREGVVADSLKTLFNSIYSAGVQTKEPAATKKTSTRPATGEKTTVDDAALVSAVDTALGQIGSMSVNIGDSAEKAIMSQGDKKIVDAYEDIIDGMASDIEKALASIISKWGQEAQARGLSAGISISAITTAIMQGISGKNI